MKDTLFCLLGPRGAGKTIIVISPSEITPITAGNGNWMLLTANKNLIFCWLIMK